MDKTFTSLLVSFKDSIKTWDYFVNWDKVSANTVSLEISLNTLNYLLGKENLKKEFLRLYELNPHIAKTLPILLAVREKKLEVFDKNTKGSKFFDFSNSETSAEQYFEFIEKSGLSRLFQKDGVKNLVDYVTGVEVGLDSNARKNRSGTLMEKVVNSHIVDFCKKKGFECMAQARPTHMQTKWGYNVEINKSERSFDFAIYNPHTKKLKLFETNFYNGRGSKLKTVCGEFRNLYDELTRQGIDFIWVTDGLGWNSAKRPLEETYDHNLGGIVNLNMLENGVLDELQW